MPQPRKNRSDTAAHRRRAWVFRAAAATLVPAAVLLLAELALRLAGYGYPSGFWQPVEGRAGTLTSNQRFGWRFFPRRLARTPVPLELAAAKGDSYRIFVVGGSAARGTPEPAYSFGRILEVMLEHSFPDVGFEVHNAAMTAINSHVVLPIVRDCAARRPDLFVVYLGNNEVVGPFGAATVFDDFAPSLRAVRAAVALRATRLGQLLAAVLGTDGGAGDDHRQWRGMEMFLERRLAADDPRLAKVARHLDRNLADMVRAAHRAGARTVLATVATNLRDQRPFASLHRESLAAAQRQRWRELYDAALARAAAGEHAAAAEGFARAAEIDDRHAELHFHHGRSLYALGRREAARRSLVRARDLDALRFRADSRINDTIRGVAERQAARGVSLVDAARLFAEGPAGDGEPAGGVPPGGLAGGELFHEHVHLSFAGNYALATAVFGAVREALPEAIRRREAVGQPLPSRLEVAEQLALTPFDEVELERDIFQIVSRPPFTERGSEDPEVERRRQRLAALRRALAPRSWRAAEELYRRRLAADPDDLDLRRRFAVRLESRGRAEEALEHRRWLAERLPGVAAWRAALALTLADAGRPGEALGELRRLLTVEGDSPGLRNNLGTVLEKQGDRAAALAEYRRALELDPADVMARYNLGTAELRGGEAEAAVRSFGVLLEQHPGFAPAHHNLGQALERRGDLRSAVASYRRAIAAQPEMAKAHNSLGFALERLGAAREAAAAYTAALAFDPGYALAHFNLADLLFSRGHAAAAVPHYERGLELAPDNAQARANRAAALRSLEGEH